MDQDYNPELRQLKHFCVPSNNHPSKNKFKAKAKSKAKAESIAELYPCDIWKYMRRYNMKVLMDIKHAEGRNMKWICNFSGESLHCKINLERHIKANHLALNPIQGEPTPLSI